MNHARLQAVLTGIAGLAAQASAQFGLATYSIAFGTPTGPSSIMLSPGESAHVFVNVSFNPGVGQPIGNYTPAGLSDGAFSISGAGSGNGAWILDTNTSSPTYSLPHPWGALQSQHGGNPGTPSGNSVSNVWWGYGFLFSLPHPYPQNPANVWRARFSANSVGVVSFSITPGSTGVFAKAAGSALPTVLTYQSVGLGGMVTIVPAPGVFALLAPAVVMASRRQRTRHRGES